MSQFVLFKKRLDEVRSSKPETIEAVEEIVYDNTGAGGPNGSMLNWKKRLDEARKTGGEPPKAVRVYYHSMPLRANQIRLCLAAGGVEFDDILADSFPPSKACKDGWVELGGNSTTNVPMLVIDEGTPDMKVFTQSTAVLRQAARMAKLELKPYMQGGKVRARYLQDKLIADANDLRSAAYKALVPLGATQQEVEKFVKTGYPLHAKNLERQFLEGKKPYFYSDTISVVDITVYDAIVTSGSNWLAGIPGIGDDPIGMIVPGLMEWVQRVESNPGIVKYKASKQYKSIKFPYADKEMLGYSAGPEADVKIYYHSMPLRANAIRLCLAAGNVEFEDDLADRFPPTDACKEKWSKLGGNSTSNVPMMTVGEQVYTQPNAILRQAAFMAKLELQPPTDLGEDQAEYLQDKLLADADDLRSASYKAISVFGATKAESDKFITEVFPLHAKNLERQFLAGKKPFFYSDTLSVVDISVYDVIVSNGSKWLKDIDVVGGNPLATIAPGLVEWSKRVEAYPGIAKYYKSAKYKKLALKFDDKSVLGY